MAFTVLFQQPSSFFDRQNLPTESPGQEASHHRSIPVGMVQGIHMFLDLLAQQLSYASAANPDAP